MLNNLSSDELRRQLGENNAAMNTLAEDNQKIVELLAERGLQATDKTIKGPGLLVDAMKEAFKADRIVVHDALGSEVFNTAWPNPLVRPEPHETAHCMAERPEGLAEDKESSVPLTTDKVKADSWWCAVTAKSVAERMREKHRRDKLAEEERLTPLLSKTIKLQSKTIKLQLFHSTSEALDRLLIEAGIDEPQDVINRLIHGAKLLTPEQKKTIFS